MTPDRALRFTVLGKPEPAGSKRGFKHPHTGQVIVVDANAKAKPWKQEVAGAAHGALADAGGWAGLLTGPLRLEVTFYLARPKSHYGTGRNSRKLKDSAPAYPAVKPDTTKLLRAVEDALTTVVWRDDAQVVEQAASKVYGTPERCEVVVTELAATVVVDVHELEAA